MQIYYRRRICPRLTIEKPRFTIKEPKYLSARVRWLRDYYFEGVKRKWNNEYTSWTTGTPWDFQYNELSFYIVPETYFYIPTFRSSFKQTRQTGDPAPGLLELEPARTARLVPQGGDGQVPAQGDPARRPAGRGALQRDDLALPDRKGNQRIRQAGLRQEAARARPCCGSTTTATATPAPPAGTSSPVTRRIIEEGWKAVNADLQSALRRTVRSRDKKGSKGAQLRAMLTASTLARDLAAEYRRSCWSSWLPKKPTPRAKPNCEQMAAQPRARALGTGAQPSGKPCSRCG